MSEGIRDFYSGKTILITGATGFVGKFLLEKILRSTHVDKVYILIRPKKGLSSQERLEKFLEQPLFQFKLHEDDLKRVALLEGDIQNPQLVTDLNVLEKVRKEITIVIHSAANIKLTDTYESHFESNVAGTNNVLNFTKSLEKVDSFLHISSLTALMHEDHIYERVTSSVPDLETLMKKYATDDIQWLLGISSPLASSYATEYSFSKNIAEVLVKHVAEENKFPAGVFRMGLSNAALREPKVGFADDYRQGTTGSLLFYMMGLLSVVYNVHQYEFLSSSVDSIVNHIIVATCDASKQTDALSVYNMKVKRQNGEQLFHQVHDSIQKFPSIRCVRPITVITSTSKYLFPLLSLVYDKMYLFMFDLYLMVTGHKPRLLSTFKSLESMVEAYFKYIKMLGMDIKSDRMEMIMSNIPNDEKEIFYADPDIIPEEYYDQWVLSARKYILKESEDTIESAKKRCDMISYYLMLFKVVVSCVFISIIANKLF